ncbi:radical SAM protein, partial [Bacteroidota bacterium]
MIHPKEAIVSFTNKCNLRCAMCDIPKNKDFINIPSDKLYRLIDDLAKIKCKNLVFSGGEPLVHRNIYDLVKHGSKKGLKVCITSNGTLINKKNAKKLSDSKINVVNISVDGNENTHDKLRGKGNYKKAIDALENLREEGVETTIAAIICRQNYKELVSIIELAKNKGATTVRFQPFSNDFLDKEDKNFFITEKQG